MTQHQQNTDIKAIMELMQQVRGPIACYFCPNLGSVRSISHLPPIMIPKDLRQICIEYKNPQENSLQTCIYSVGKYVDLASTLSAGQVLWIFGRDYT